MFDVINKYLSKCERVLTHISLWTTFAIMIVITGDSIGRYLFNRSIIGIYEITESYLIVMAIFMAAGYTYRKGGCIRVTLFMDKMPNRMRIPINYFVQILSILFCLSLLITSSIRAFHEIGSGAILGNLNLPLWPGYVLVPVGLLFIILPMILDLPKVKSGQSALFQGEFEEAVIDDESNYENKISGEGR